MRHRLDEKEEWNGDINFVLLRFSTNAVQNYYFLISMLLSIDSLPKGCRLRGEIGATGNEMHALGGDTLLPVSLLLIWHWLNMGAI